MLHDLRGTCCRSPVVGGGCVRRRGGHKGPKEARPPRSPFERARPSSHPLATTCLYDSWSLGGPAGPGSAWARPAGAAVVCNCRTKETWPAIEPSPLESTANGGTASLEASRGPSSLQARWDVQEHEEAFKSVACGALSHVAVTPNDAATALSPTGMIIKAHCDWSIPLKINFRWGAVLQRLMRSIGIVKRKIPTKPFMCF